MSRNSESVIIYIVMMVVVIGLVWGAMYLLSSRVENIKVVEVEPGVHCAITSRMLNTSIDCWKVDE